MSAPAPATRRSASGSRRFNALKALQPKRRLQQILASSPVPVTRPESGSGAAAPAAAAPVSVPVPAPPARSPAAPSNRDPYGNASLSSSSNSGSCKGSDCSPTKGRNQKYISCTDNHGIRPPPPEQYLTPLQQKEVCIRHLRARLKETMNTLQDRDTEIDELREKLYRMQEDWVEEECHRVEAQLALKEARLEIQQLKQAVDTVRDRLSDAGGFSGDIGVQKYFQDINTQNHKLENLLLNMELAQVGLVKEGEAIAGRRTRVGGSAPASVSGESPGGIPKSAIGGRGSCSCDGSPARSLTRSSTYTKLSDQAANKNGSGADFPCLSANGTQDSGFVCCGENSSVPSRADLLLEAAYLSEETASLLNSYAQTFSHTTPKSLPLMYSQTLPHSFPHNLSHSAPHTMPHSATYEKLCSGERLSTFRCGPGGGGCMSHPCLSHHHLYLHPLREAGIQTESCPIPATSGCPSDLDTIAEQRTFRSQACSPTSTWMSDEGEEDVDSITTTTSVTRSTVMSIATEPIPFSQFPRVNSIPRSATVACSLESPLDEGKEGTKDVTEEEPDGMDNQGEIALVQSAGVQFEVEAAKLVGNQEESKEAAVCSSEEDRPGGPLETPKSINIQQTDVQIQIEAPGWSPCSPESPQDIEQPHICQPKRSISHEGIVLGVQDSECDEDSENEEQGDGGSGAGVEEAESPSASTSVQKSYWSRHFLVDLLAVAIPVVPTVAWLCRGPVRGGHPIYHFGSLLRGCCTVALHSLRRGGGLRHYPAGGGDLGGSQM
ncbi:syntaphilin isoform X1 [Syngnathoides biaculeatus]|uniref:syntaphilin isoform X1 n=1 Tax=Syngnathoides biaculeatus TaxID=300417 RepID=UPI002ADDBC0E|nr:syntaphilin isoform X1 [Syngnathoides biaculeatus]XP_061695803.1 syntaphilin isoform X1 [Syngnathoides biaculeatus]XP_061695810.1 syntaphilin isoform X1 [Syngnathoides biaculeatus]